MNRRYALIIVLVLSVSVLLLGLSYAKDSSVSKYVNEFENYDGNLKIVSSETMKDITFNDVLERDVSVTNRGGYSTSFVVEVVSDSIEDLSYSIDDGSKEKINDRIILTKELNKLGDDNDHFSFKIKIFSDNKDKHNITLKVYEKVNYLKDKIIEDTNVYKDELNNYRYYGTDVNNYANYMGEEYQIVGLINNNIVLIEANKKNGVYNSEDEYLTINDYLASFNDANVNVYNVSNYSSWLNDSYWFQDTYGNSKAYYLENGIISSREQRTDLYRRKIVRIYNDAEVTLGNGSKEKPYEVVYDS